MASYSQVRDQAEGVASVQEEIRYFFLIKIILLSDFESRRMLYEQQCSIKNGNTCNNNNIIIKWLLITSTSTLGVLSAQTQGQQNNYNYM
jgi:hypothetical protein